MRWKMGRKYILSLRTCFNMHPSLDVAANETEFFLIKETDTIREMRISNFSVIDSIEYFPFFYKVATTARVSFEGKLNRTVIKLNNYVTKNNTDILRVGAFGSETNQREYINNEVINHKMTFGNKIRFSGKRMFYPRLFILLLSLSLLVYLKKCDTFFLFFTLLLFAVDIFFKGSILSLTFFLL